MVSSSFIVITIFCGLLCGLFVDVAKCVDDGGDDDDGEEDNFKFCDQNCIEPGFFCVENAPNTYTECEDEARWILYCSDGQVWDSRSSSCTSPSPSLPPCRCSSTSSTDDAVRPPPVPAQAPAPAIVKFVTKRPPIRTQAIKVDKRPAANDDTIIIAVPVQSVHKAEDVTIDDDCLECICQATTKCNLHFGCQSGFCGPFRISQPYFEDSGVGSSSSSSSSNQPASIGFRQCSTDRQCAERVVEGYMRRYAPICLANSAPNNNNNEDDDDDDGDEQRQKYRCSDLARIHIGGPNGCKTPSTELSGRRVGACYAKLRRRRQNRQNDDRTGSNAAAAPAVITTMKKKQPVVVVAHPAHAPAIAPPAYLPPQAGYQRPAYNRPAYSQPVSSYYPQQQQQQQHTWSTVTQ